MISSIPSASFLIRKRLCCHLRRARCFSSTKGLTAEEAGRLASEYVQNGNASRKNAIETHLSHAGTKATGSNLAMAPPLHVATTYTRPPDGNYKEG
jgi:hypothetical protein